MSTLACTRSNTRLLRTLGSISRKANFPSWPGTTSRRMPTSCSLHRVRNSATSGNAEGRPRRTASSPAKATISTKSVYPRDPPREVVGLVDDQHEVVQGPAEPRQEALEDLAEQIVVVAHDQVRPRGGVHRHLVRADATRPARPDELLHVERPLEDRGDDRGVVPREERARPRLDLVVAELVERAAVCGSALLETHRLLRDQVDRGDPRSPRLDPADGLDRDAMLALPRRQEQDELVRAERILKGRDQGDRGLADAGRRVGEEVPAVRDRETGVREEVGLALAHSIEGPWDPDGARRPGDGSPERCQ